jgi:Acetyltransferases, including N-acetylases of ribosomal proteins
LALRIVFDDSDAVASWVLARLPDVHGFGQCVALGVADKNGTLLMGIVFSDYQPQWGTMQLSIAADSPRWAHKGIIKQLLAYPFEQAGVQKLWAAHEHTNVRAQRLSKGLGFKHEGTLAQHFGPRKHAVISRMFREDYQRLYGRSSS